MATGFVLADSAIERIAVAMPELAQTLVSWTLWVNRMR